jgi:hypothetical protein
VFVRGALQRFVRCCVGEVSVTYFALIHLCVALCFAVLSACGVTVYCAILEYREFYCSSVV